MDTLSNILIDKNMTCATCGGTLPASADTGRPRTYCGEPCKRAAGYEITRINRRLEKLENNLNKLKGQEKLLEKVKSSSNLN